MKTIIMMILALTSTLVFAQSLEHKTCQLVIDTNSNLPLTDNVKKTLAQKGYKIQGYRSMVNEVFKGDHLSTMKAVSLLTEAIPESSRGVVKTLCENGQKYLRVRYQQDDFIGLVFEIYSTLENVDECVQSTMKNANEDGDVKIVHSQSIKNPGTDLTSELEKLPACKVPASTATKL